MPISSYVIQCAPADQPALRLRLHAMAGVDVGEGTETGMPVVADTPSTRAATELGEQLQQLPGVTSAVLVYHNFEDVVDESPAPATPNQNN